MYILIYNIFGIWIDSTCESYLVSIRLIYMRMLFSEHKFTKRFLSLRDRMLCQSSTYGSKYRVKQLIRKYRITRTFINSNTCIWLIDLYIFATVNVISFLFFICLTHCYLSSDFLFCFFELPSLPFELGITSDISLQLEKFIFFFNVNDKLKYNNNILCSVSGFLPIC